MYSCYLDESGTPEPAGTSHFVLVGFAIPGTHWKSLETRIQNIKNSFGVESEVQTFAVTSFVDTLKIMMKTC